MKSFGQGNPQIGEYVANLLGPSDPALEEIEARTAAAKLPPIQVAPLDGRHLEVLARASGAKKAVEIGTLAGYSGLCLLRGLPSDGHLDTFEISEAHAVQARVTFEKNAVADRVMVHVGAARDLLPTISAKAPFDLVFIDADKVNYVVYLEWATANLRPGGILIADNTFAWGEIAFEPHGDSPEAAAVTALRRFNKVLADSPDYRVTMLPTGEGLTLAVRL